MRFREGRVVDGPAGGGGVGEADLLGQDRLAGAGRPGQHRDRTRLKPAAEYHVEAGNAGEQSIHVGSPRLASRVFAAARISSDRQLLDSSASAVPASSPFPVTARIGIWAVAGSARRRRISSRPSITGIIMSVTTSSGGDSRTDSRACAP